jgi:hypothetical protein
MKTPDRRALRRIELKNLLSFGPDSPALELWQSFPFETSGRNLRTGDRLKY